MHTYKEYDEDEEQGDDPFHLQHSQASEPVNGRSSTVSNSEKATTISKEDQEDSEQSPSPPPALWVRENEEDEWVPLRSTADAQNGLSQEMSRVFSNTDVSGKAAPDAQHGNGTPASPPTNGRTTFPWKSVFMCVTIIVLLLVGGTGSMLLFAHAAKTHLPLGNPSVPKSTAARTTHRDQQPITNRSVLPTAVPSQPVSTTSTSEWVPATLPGGWASAGLSTVDALDAERVAWTFTDREMSLDYRSVGTRIQHSGTFTAATFLLSPGGTQRFAQNDVRVTGNTFFDKVQQEQLIQEVYDARPSLVNFQVQGGREFAWVDVSFQLWQSQVNATTGTRMEGREIQPTTQQPMIHHMVVLLVHVQGKAQPAMGATLWLVSTYELDTPLSQVSIIQPI